MQAEISQDGLVADRKPTPIIRDADQLLRRGIDALEHDRFEEAAGLLRQTVELAPQSPIASPALGIALARLGGRFPAQDKARNSRARRSASPGSGSHRARGA